MSRHVVMLLSNGFSSDPRVEKEARALLAAGWRVTVLAWDRVGELSIREDRDGIEVERLGPRSGYGRGLANLGAFREFWAKAAERTSHLAPTVVHCHDMDTAPAGLRVASTGDSRLLIDLHELYRDSNMVPQSGLVGLMSRAAVERLERRVVSRADAVVVANPGAVDHYRAFGPRREIAVVENAPDMDRFMPAAHRRSPDSPFVVGYFGQKRYLEGLDVLMRAVQRAPGLEAILAGGGTAASDVARLAAGYDRVSDSGPFAYEELPELYRGVDVVYAVYDTGLGNVRTLFPVKVMEAMACGLPSVVAEGTWIGAYVLEHDVGVTVPTGDVDALTARLSALKDDPGTADAMGENGRRIVEDHLNWRAASQRLLGVYERL